MQCYATTAELVEVCRVVAEFDGLYATHVRYKKGLLVALAEAVEIARRSGVRLHISHLKAPRGDEAGRVLEFIDAAGNNSNSIEPISDDIILDTEDPTGTIAINSGDAATNDRFGGPGSHRAVGAGGRFEHWRSTAG